MIILQCDKCNELGEPQHNDVARDGWVEIKYYISSSAGYKKYMLCPACRSKLGIPDVRDQGQRKSIGDNLMEIIASIAQEAAHNDQP